jgi:mRNA-degrading endonuclease RelE of RelBE toxin-antitoxin system
VSWQPRRIIWSRDAVRALADLTRRDRTQAATIRTHIRAYASIGVGDVRKLAGRGAEYRLRVDNWRVIFTFGADPESGEATLVVMTVGNRRDIY